ncbi:hypothetical protein BJ741DRAFT_588927 [Chytriomyces cf. hyalinus JEL632]|nr:hypothetical protein BJ741DRAFT_588927 [Chytriomyces cf. hyalinus JEL632]
MSFFESAAAAAAAAPWTLCNNSISTNTQPPSHEEYAARMHQHCFPQPPSCYPDLSQRDMAVHYPSPASFIHHPATLPQQHRMSIQFLIEADGGNPHRDGHLLSTNSTLTLHRKLNYPPSPLPPNSPTRSPPRSRKQHSPPHPYNPTSKSCSPSSPELQLRNFPCTFSGCQSRFLRKHHLESHLNTHYSQKAFRCDIPGCSSAFSRLHDLQRHKRTVRH